MGVVGGCYTKVMIKSYNIVIVPSQIVHERAVFVSELIAKTKETHFILDSKSFFPHITLYHVNLDEAVIPDLVDSLQTMVASIEPFEMKENEYALINTEWVDRGYERSQKIQDLHQSVLETGVPFHKKSDGELKEEWSDLSPARKENLELYGWSEARDLYRPHLTLTRLKERAGEEILRELPEVGFSFMATEVALYEMGEYGTCKTLVGIFSFRTTLENL